MNIPTILAFVAAAPGGQADSDYTYAVAPVRSALAADERVGARRTGRLCLPAGAIKWSDAKPDPQASAEAIATALTERGVRALTTDDLIGERVIGLRVRRLTITVVAARIDACVPQHGLARMIGGRSRLKATGSVKLRLRLVTPDAEPVVEEHDAEETLKAEDGSTLGALVSAALVRSSATLRFDGEGNATGR